MCVIVLKPKGKKVSKEDMLNCYSHNSHGSGVAIADGEQLPIYKSMGAFESFWKILEANQDKTLLIHFRIATSGKTKKQNAHPFYLNGEQSLAFAHNGILTSYIPKEKGSIISDTMIFSKQVLKPLVKLGNHALFNPILLELLGQHIGTYNKMVFLSKDGEYSIANESQGKWREGVWFSNENWDSSCWFGYGSRPRKITTKKTKTKKTKTKKTKRNAKKRVQFQDRKMINKLLVDQIQNGINYERCRICNTVYFVDEWETENGLLFDGTKDPVCVDCLIA
jgi:hypothetical protein